MRRRPRTDGEPVQRRWRDGEPPETGRVASDDERIGTLLRGVADPGPLPPARLDQVWSRLGRKLKLDFNDVPDAAALAAETERSRRDTGVEGSFEASTVQSRAAGASRLTRGRPLFGLRWAAIALVLLGTGGVVLARREVAHVLTLVAARLDPNVRPSFEPERDRRGGGRDSGRRAASPERAREPAGVPQVAHQEPMVPPPAAPAETEPPGARLPEHPVTDSARAAPSRLRMLALEGPSLVQSRRARLDSVGSTRPRDPAEAAHLPERSPIAPPPLTASGAAEARVGDLAIAPPPFVPRVDSPPAAAGAASRSASSSRGRDPVSAPSAGLATETRLIRVAIERLRTRGDASGALATLDQHRSQFPNGLLRTDAEMVRIEALLALGRDTEALLTLERQNLGSLPRSVELQLARGELRARRDCHAAIGDFDRVLGQGASAELAERALRGRAICRFRVGQRASAAADLRTYLERFPNGKLAAEARRRLGE